MLKVKIRSFKSLDSMADGAESKQMVDDSYDVLVVVEVLGVEQVTISHSEFATRCNVLRDILLHTPIKTKRYVRKKLVCTKFDPTYQPEVYKNHSPFA